MSHVCPVCDGLGTVWPKGRPGSERVRCKACGGFGFRDTWPDTSLATGLTEGIRYRVIRLCAICDRRPGEMAVVIEGTVVECCGTCWERTADEGTGLTREMTK